jgi:formylmethanofuran dehydrogenase subunit A
MLVNFDTRKLSLKEGDILICDGKRVTTISKTSLLKPLWTEIELMKQSMRENEKQLEIKFNEFKVQKIKELITR